MITQEQLKEQINIAYKSQGLYLSNSEMFDVVSKHLANWLLSQLPPAQVGWKFVRADNLEELPKEEKTYLYRWFSKYNNYYFNASGGTVGMKTLLERGDALFIEYLLESAPEESRIVQEHGELLLRLKALVKDVRNKPMDTRYNTQLKLSESLITKIESNGK